MLTELSLLHMDKNQINNFPITFTGQIHFEFSSTLIK